jgi:fatty-acyl-CoA synthase/long-chain acyl-CoA synthetase
MNIYPAEIEAVLERHPGIYDVAVFGIPSEEWGEAVHATVVRSPGSSLTGEEIAAFAREHLAGYKVPRSVDFTAELPRTGSGKLLKRQLRAPYWAGMARLFYGITLPCIRGHSYDRLLLYGVVEEMGEDA